MVESQKLPEYNMDTMPLRRGHILILMIASAGQFFGGALAILVGVIAPLIAIILDYLPGCRGLSLLAD